MNIPDLAALTYPLIIVCKLDEENYRVTQAVGTAFFIAKNVVATCWHCVSAILPSNHFYGLRYERSPGKFSVAVLSSIERDKYGTDMATAITSYDPPHQLSLSKKGAKYGDEVWTFAYPYTETSQKNGELMFNISGRFLRGYITRNFYYPHHQLGESEVFELDMSTPPGTSGAPLMRKGTFEVIGLIFGTVDVSTVVENASIGQDGTKYPEVVRLNSFGLAYDHDWTSRLTTSHTNNMPLIEMQLP